MLRTGRYDTQPAVVWITSFCSVLSPESWGLFDPVFLDPACEVHGSQTGGYVALCSIWIAFLAEITSGSADPFVEVNLDSLLAFTISLIRCNLRVLLLDGPRASSLVHDWLKAGDLRQAVAFLCPRNCCGTIDDGGYCGPLQRPLRALTFLICPAAGLAIRLHLSKISVMLGASVANRHIPPTHMFHCAISCCLPSRRWKTSPLNATVASQFIHMVPK